MVYNMVGALHQLRINGFTLKQSKLAINFDAGQSCRYTPALHGGYCSTRLANNNAEIVDFGVAPRCGAIACLSLIISGRLDIKLSPGLSFLRILHHPFRTSNSNSEIDEFFLVLGGFKLAVCNMYRSVEKRIS